MGGGERGAMSPHDSHHRRADLDSRIRWARLQLRREMARRLDEPRALCVRCRIRAALGARCWACWVETIADLETERDTDGQG